MGILSRFSIVSIFLILLLVDCSSLKEMESDTDYYTKFWVSAFNNTLYVESWVTKHNFDGSLTVFNDNHRKIYRVKLLKDIVDLDTLQLGPAWEKGMSVSTSANGQGCILTVKELRCAYNNTEILSLWIKRGLKKAVGITIQFESLSPSSPRIINPYGVQLKVAHTYTFHCTAYTAEHEKMTDLRWLMTHRGRSYVLLENSGGVHSTFVEGEPACTISQVNTSLTLKIKHEDQGMLLRCLLINPDYNTMQQAGAVNNCLSNQWCDAMDPVDVLCKNGGSWEIEHCSGVDTRVYIIIPFAILACLFLACLYILQKKKNVVGTGRRYTNTTRRSAATAFRSS